MALRHNAIVRLRHVATGKWLHSGWHQGHHFKSIISQSQQEVRLSCWKNPSGKIPRARTCAQLPHSHVGRTLVPLSVASGVNKRFGLLEVWFPTGGSGNVSSH
jgi:hypothetical protein